MDDDFATMGLTDRLFSKNKGAEEEASEAPVANVEDVQIQESPATEPDRRSFTERFWPNRGKETPVKELQSPTASNSRQPNGKSPEGGQAAKKGGGFWFTKKAPEPEPEPIEIDSEDIFSGPRVKKLAKEELPAKKKKKGRKSKHHVEETKPAEDDFVRVKVWVRRNRNEPFRPGKFCDCLVDYFAGSDQRNIYSAPSVQFEGTNSLQVPKLSGRRSSKDHSDTGSIKSSSDYFSSGSSSPFLGCCGSARSSALLSPNLSARGQASDKLEAISVTVECILQDNRVLMQPAPPEEPVERHHSKIRQSRRRPGSAVSYIAVLEHPSFCCAHRIAPKDYEKLPDEIKKRGIDVGVSVLLESGDQKILITRRAQHMRTFPGVWVPPGGHIEDGESILDAGIREVFEETGLVLKKGAKVDTVLLEPPPAEKDKDNNDREVEEDIIDDDHNLNKYNLLGLWESCYPPVLYAGQPKRQHLVYYLHIQVTQHSDLIQQYLKLERSEVGACAWLDRSHAEVVAYSSRPLPDKPVPITILDWQSDTTSEGSMDPKILRKKMPEPTREIERLTTGTRYALKLWLGMQEEEGRELESALL